MNNPEKDLELLEQNTDDVVSPAVEDVQAVEDTEQEASDKVQAVEETEQETSDKVQAVEETAKPCDCSSANTAKKDSFSFKIASVLFDTLEIFVVSVVAVLLVFTFGIRLCRVSGTSMNQTLENNELLITSNLFYEPRQGDIVVFHLSNQYYEEPLVKRVIATEGQTVLINITTGATYVDGELIEESYAHFNQNGGYNMGEISILFDSSYISINEHGESVFSATVPEGKIFVMGDNRNNSSDSRNKKVGFVDKDCVLGKALFRLSPFTKLS